MISRREFIKLAGVSTLALAVTSKTGLRNIVYAQIPGGTLDPLSVKKFKTPLLIPPVMPRAGMIKLQGGKNADYYEISMRQFNQQILPAGMPMTTVWGYGAVASNSKRGLLLHNAPSLTIRPTGRFKCELVDTNGNYRCCRSTRPFTGLIRPAAIWGGICGDSTPGYTGPVYRDVHGAVGVGDESDGYAEAYAGGGKHYSYARHLVRFLLRQGRRNTEPSGGLASPLSNILTISAHPPSGITTIPHDAPQCLYRSGGFLLFVVVRPAIFTLRYEGHFARSGTQG
jgi:hypothetical protein